MPVPKILHIEDGSAVPITLATIVELFQKNDALFRANEELRQLVANLDIDRETLNRRTRKMNAYAKMLKKILEQTTFLMRTIDKEYMEVLTW